MTDVKILFSFELYLNGLLVGHENHAIDPTLPARAGIGIYHKPLSSSLLAGNPVTGGDKNYIFHNKKKLVKQND